MTFTPCSQRLIESITGAYPGDTAHWKAKGGKIIEFRDWLKAHKGH